MRDNIEAKLKNLKSMTKEERLDLMQTINDNLEVFESLTVKELSELTKTIADDIGVDINDLANFGSKKEEEEDTSVAKLHKIIIIGYEGDQSPAAKTSVIVGFNKLLTPDLNIPEDVKRAEWSLTKIKEKILGVSSQPAITFDFPGEFVKNDAKLGELTKKLKDDMKLIIKIQVI